MIFIMDLQMMMLDVLYFILRNSLRIVLRPRTKPIDGELVLITGAGGGLGRLFAQEFSKHGADVVLWDINSSANEQTAKLVHEMGGKAYPYTVDVTNREDVYRNADQVRRDLGRDITILVNNAGVVAGERLLDCPDELMERTMKVNCHALFWVSPLGLVMGGWMDGYYKPVMFGNWYQCRLSILIQVMFRLKPLLPREILMVCVSDLGSGVLVIAFMKEMIKRALATDPRSELVKYRTGPVQQMMGNISNISECQYLTHMCQEWYKSCCHQIGPNL